MKTIAELDRIAITVKSHRLLQKLLEENPQLEEIMRKAMNETEALVGVHTPTSSKDRPSSSYMALKASDWKFRSSPIPGAAFPTHTN